MTNVIPRNKTYFQARTKVTETGCWEWQLQTAKPGHGRGGLYGRARCPEEGRSIGAHVLAYKNLVGPIPDGYEVDHTCRNTLCCNPDHLEAVTPKENNRRRAAAGDATNQNTGKTHCPVHGTPYDMESKRGDGRKFQSCRACYNDYQREYQRGVRARRKAGNS